MTFQNPGEYLDVKDDGNTVTWKENDILNNGCVFTKDNIPINKAKILCKLVLKADCYGRVLVGVALKNPVECFGHLDGQQWVDYDALKRIRYVSVKNRKETHVEFTYNGSLVSTIKYDESATHQPLHTEIPPGTKSFWIFVKFIFGDICVSLTGGPLGSYQFMKMGNLSTNTVLNSDGSAQLEDTLLGHRCKLSRKLSEWDVLVLKVSKEVPKGEGRSLFKMNFSRQPCDKLPPTNDSMNTYYKENMESEICFVHQGHSIICGDEVVCPLIEQRSVEIQIEIVLSRVQLITHRTARCDVDRRPSNDSSSSSYASISSHHPNERSIPCSTEHILQRSYYQLRKHINYLEVLDVLYSKFKMTKEEHRKRVYDKDNDDEMKKRRTVEWMEDHANSISLGDLIDIFLLVGQENLLVISQGN